MALISNGVVHTDCSCFWISEMGVVIMAWGVCLGLSKWEDWPGFRTVLPNWLVG